MTTPTPGPVAPIVSDYLTTDEACAYLNISKKTLYAWTRSLRVKRGRLVRWRRQELDRMAEASMRTMR